MSNTFHEEEILGKAYDSRLMRRLLQYLRPYWRMTLFALIAILLYGMLAGRPGVFDERWKWTVTLTRRAASTFRPSSRVS